MPVRAKGLFWGCGYTGYTKKVNFCQCNLQFNFFRFSVLVFCKVFEFSVFSVTLIGAASVVLGYTEKKFSVTEVIKYAVSQYSTGLHWNFHSTIDLIKNKQKQNK